MSIDGHLRNAFSAFRDREALVDGERRWTYRELEGIVSRVAAALAFKLPRGSRVGLYLQNRAEYLILQLAIERSGLVRVPLNIRFTAVEVERVVEDCEASAVFFDHKTADRVGRLGATGLWLCDVDGETQGGPSWSALTRYDGPAASAGDDLDALCSINYTSGSTGTPKGVMLSHRNWHSLYKNMLVDRDILGTDRLAHIGPLTHASGTYFLPFFLRGAVNVVVPGGSLDALLPTIERERITAFSCVPTVLTRILSSSSIDEYDLSSIRWIGYGAEAIQRNTLDRALRRWGPVLSHNYGLTEAMMTCTHLTAADHVVSTGHDAGLLRFGCIGRPYSFVDIALRDPEGRAVGPDEVGEVTIQAEHVMQGYWNRPEETGKVLRDGWLWSGDLARRDADGFIYLVGRSKEMLISGGFNIYPTEVEACLSSCPGIQEVAVVGIPDEMLGEIAVAFIVIERGSGLKDKDCERFCKPLIGIQTPRKWFIVPDLPRTGNGKVDKAALHAHLRATEEASP